MHVEGYYRSIAIFLLLRLLASWETFSIRSFFLPQLFCTEQKGLGMRFTVRSIRHGEVSWSAPPPTHPPTGETAIQGWMAMNSNCKFDGMEFKQFGPGRVLTVMVKYERLCHLETVST